MTYEEIKEAIELENARLIHDAAAEFTRKTGAEMQKRCSELTQETAARYAQIMRGEAPLEFGAYDSDDIARILATDTIIVCTGYRFDKAADIAKAKYWTDAAVETSFYFGADESWDRAAFVDAYEKYLYTAAAFAKSIGADHAMRLYLRAWGLVHGALVGQNHDKLDADSALRVVRLERIATSRLWVDVEAARLPAFKPQRPAGPRKAAAKKRKAGR